MTSYLHEEPITVVGAGLAGSLMALALAQRDQRVRVLERRGDLRLLDKAQGKSINLALSTRGLSALDAVGLRKEVEAIGVPMTARAIHATSGEVTRQPYGRQGEALLSVNRRTLNELLLDRAEASGRIEFVFDAKLLDFDIASGELTVKHRAHFHPRKHASRLVIGADGAFSAVRTRMMKTERFNYSQTYLNYGYKELTIEPDAHGNPRLDMDALHIWPRSSFMLIALPNTDKSFTLTLFLAYEGDKESFEALTDEASLLTFFETHFPDTLGLFDDLAGEFFSNPVGSLCYIQCAPYHRGQRCVIIGDAAHAVVPFYGQGLNAAFEDCRLLSEYIDQHGFERIDAAIAHFSHTRKADADAICELALQNFIEMRASVADPRFLAHKALQRVLSLSFPEHYRSLYELVTFSNTPYAEAVSSSAQTETLLAAPDARLGLLVFALLRRMYRSA